MKNKLRQGLIMIAILAGINSASAFIVYDNFGPNDTFNQSQFGSVTWNVLASGSSINAASGIAARFTPVNDFALSSVTLAVGYLQDTNNLAVMLVADNAGTPSGAVIETVVVHPSDITGFYGVKTYPSSLEPVMAGGLSYWLVVEPVDHNTTSPENNAAYAWWASGSFGYAAARDFNFGTGIWANWQVFPDTLLPAFRIEGTVAPEPGTLVLALAGGLGWLGICRWQSRRR